MIEIETKIILFVNQKDGSAKSKTVAAIGYVFARKLKKRTLLIDSDPQATLSRRFGYCIGEMPEVSLDMYLVNEMEARHGQAEHLPASVFVSEALSNVSKEPHIYRNKKGESMLNIICASDKLEDAYTRMQIDSNSGDGIIRKLLLELCDDKRYDYILIDTRPSINYSFGQLLLGSDYVIVPSTTSDETIRGANSIGENYNVALEKKSEYGRRNTLDFLGIFTSMVRTGTKLGRELQEHPEHFYGNNPSFESIIPFNQDVNNSEQKMAPVTLAYPRSVAAKAYEKLAKEILKKIEKLVKEAGEKNG